MISRFGEENGRAAAANGSSAGIARSAESVDFEQLLADLSAAFVRVPAEQVDAEIDRWLQSIVLALNIDRSTIQADLVDGIFQPPYQWARHARDPVERERMLAATSFPWLTAKVFSGEVVVISRLE